MQQLLSADGCVGSEPHSALTKANCSAQPGSMLTPSPTTDCMPPVKVPQPAFMRMSMPQSDSAMVVMSSRVPSIATLTTSE